MNVLEGLLNRFRPKGSIGRDGIHVADSVANKFLSDPDFPWLISFPRTGSHWLRMIMELYFERPSLRRAFFYPNAAEFTCYHWHDVDLTTQARNVIYLYRHPVDTIYSTLQYHKEDIDDAGRVRHWAEIYARHLKKWILDDTTTTRKVVIRYEGLREEPVEEFAKICAHLRMPMDAQRLTQVMARVSKDELKKLTGHDQQVVNLSHGYSTQRDTFRDRSTTLIMHSVNVIDSRLASLWRGGERVQS